jgi:lipid-binding SYLF domain-containing protein
MPSFKELTDMAVHVMENCNVPKTLFKECAGVILVKSSEVGLVVSLSSGGGLLLKHKDGEWSNPAAVLVDKHGAGAVFGMADRDTVIVLNHFAMTSLLEKAEKGVFTLGEDIGGCLGPVGGSAASALAFGENAGGATAFIYTSQKGAMLNIEATHGGLFSAPEANEEMYGTHVLADILEGKAAPKDEAAVKEIIEKVAAYTKE